MNSLPASLPIGMFLIAFAFLTGSLQPLFPNSVSTMVGKTLLTRIYKR